MGKITQNPWERKKIEISLHLNQSWSQDSCVSLPCY